MVLESAKDATFSIRYSRDADRFMVEATGEMPILDAARLDLGEDDYLLFDNAQPGAFRIATHHADNQTAIDTLTRVIFDSGYPILCESLQLGAALYDGSERSGEIIVPYSNNRRLGRIALHAQAEGASREVTDLQQRIMLAIQQEELK